MGGVIPCHAHQWLYIRVYIHNCSHAPLQRTCQSSREQPLAAPNKRLGRHVPPSGNETALVVAGSVRACPDLDAGVGARHGQPRYVLPGEGDSMDRVSLGRKKAHPVHDQLRLPGHIHRPYTYTCADFLLRMRKTS